MTSQDYVIILLPVPQNSQKGYYFKVTLDFSISALNSLRFSFLLANKRSGMSGGHGGY